MTRRKKPVIRGDGTRFESVNDAARELIARGVHGDVKTVSGNISRAARGKRCSLAYGEFWNYEVIE